MEKGDKLFVRIDKRVKGSNISSNDFKDHINYVRTIANERFFIGGGFEKEDGGMTLIKANGIEEAKEIAENDPLIARKLYTCEIYEWNIQVLNKESN
ncbi:MAG: hypothetical protein FH751_05205 [Firmicutes bacterium]|nr:hypothetical protein [Bacillota bacterium]